MKHWSAEEQALHILVFAFHPLCHSAAVATPKQSKETRWAWPLTDNLLSQQFCTTCQILLQAQPSLPSRKAQLSRERNDQFWKLRHSMHQTVSAQHKSVFAMLTTCQMLQHSSSLTNDLINIFCFAVLALKPVVSNALHNLVCTMPKLDLEQHHKLWL